MVEYRNIHIEITERFRRKFNLGADAGHMPGAIHLPHGSMIDQTTQRLKSKEELTERKSFLAKMSFPTRNLFDVIRIKTNF